jgi:hypothetical protein
LIMTSTQRTERLSALALLAGVAGACNGILDIPEYGARAEQGGTSGSSTGGIAGERATGGNSNGGTSAGGDETGGSGAPEAGSSSGGSATETGGRGGSTGGRGGGTGGSAPGAGKGPGSAEGGSGGDGIGGASAGQGSEDGGTGGAGTSCPSTELECSGVCVNIADNAENCGACGHACLGGTCSAGKCQPLTLASGRGRLFMVQVNGDFVYYGGDGADVRRVKKDGSADIVLAASASGSPSEDKEWVYTWTLTPSAVLWGNDWVHTAVRGCDLPDCAGGAKSYVTSSANLHGMAYAASNGTLYFDEGSTVRAKVWPSGAVSDFALGQDYIGDMAADASFLYWSSCVVQQPVVCELRKKAFAGGSITPLVTSRPTGPFDLEVSGSKLYWSETGPQVYSTTLPTGTGSAAPTVFASSSSGNARHIAVNNRYVYWTLAGPNTVERCPLAGCAAGTPEVVASTDGAPWGITLDNNAVYWVTENGEVGKVAQ